MGGAGIPSAAVVAGGVAVGDGLKLAASVVTILTVAMLVRTWADFTAGVAGMAVAVAVRAFPEAFGNDGAHADVVREALVEAGPAGAGRQT